MGKGQDLYKNAKKLIPGGTMLLSKRPEMHLPEAWPSYFEKTRGCEVWDLDGNRFYDLGIMGVGTNTLGYSHPEVDQAVQDVVSKGNLSTLNCPEEVYLAEKLVEMHPWSDMIRFARTGGEANAIAIRIGRAAAGKDKVAICGYHGWHDWYLSTNLSNAKGLDGHLLPGLSPVGVPRALEGQVVPFQYNDFESLQDIVAKGDVGVIKMEVSRNEGPKDDFLQKVRKLADSNGIVLIFDECTSGFRETFGGLHLKFGVEPDIAVYGKTIANGYALTAVLGKRSVMETAQDTFISSTFWTERIGPTAALKTLEVMEREQSWDQISNTGKKVQEAWKDIASKSGVQIKVSGLPALSTFSFSNGAHLELKTFLTQELLKKGILGGTAFYASMAHKDEILRRFFDELEIVFDQISKFDLESEDLKKRLEGPVSHAGFKRLN